MDAIENLYDYKGYKIRLKVVEGIYEGFVRNVCLDPMKLSLSKVKVIEPTEFSFSDIQSFYPRDIISYDILPDSKEEASTELSSLAKNSSRNDRRWNKAKNFIFDDISDTESVIAERDGECEEFPEIDEEEEEFNLELPSHLKRRLPLDHIVIDKIDRTFHQAINHMANECIIGVSFEGSNIGRYGKLYWIGISTRLCTYLFDIDSMKETAFDSGLRSLMESVGILKVIHDSRQPSDSLQHQYNTSLRKVFDTQVADAFIAMQYTGKISDKVQPFHLCVSSYLNLESKDIYAPLKPRGMMNIPEWQFKPLRNEMRDRLIKNVIYLRLFREELVEHLLQPAYDGSDVFLNVVRNSSEKELKLLVPSKPNLMPESLLSAGLQVVRIKAFAVVNEAATNHNNRVKKWDTIDQCIEASGRFRTSSRIGKQQKRVETNSNKQITGAVVNMKDSKPLNSNREVHLNDNFVEVEISQQSSVSNQSSKKSCDIEKSSDSASGLSSNSSPKSIGTTSSWETIETSLDIPLGLSNLSTDKSYNQTVVSSTSPSKFSEDSDHDEVLKSVSRNRDFSRYKMLPG